MLSTDAVRALALKLPESEEHDHWGKPSFRTRKKIFATLHVEDQRAVLKLPLPDQAALIEMFPDIYSLGGWSHQGWTFVDLTRVDPDQFKEQLTHAWRQLAAKRAIKQLDESP